MRTIIIAVFAAPEPESATAVAGDSRVASFVALSVVISAGNGLSAEATFALVSNSVPATGALALALGVSPPADGKPPVATELSLGFESPAGCVPEKGGGAESLAVLTGVLVEGEAGVGAEDVGSEIEGDCSAVVDCGAAADFRRKMPPNPNDTGDAGSVDRPLFALSAAPTVMIVRFPSTRVV